MQSALQTQYQVCILICICIITYIGQAQWFCCGLNSMFNMKQTLVFKCLAKLPGFILILFLSICQLFLTLTSSLSSFSPSPQSLSLFVGVHSSLSLSLSFHQPKHRKEIKKISATNMVKKRSRDKKLKKAFRKKLKSLKKSF